MKLELISRWPPFKSHAPPVLFVHGALHAAWCWDEHFLGYFARQGFAAHAVSLRGHGHSDGRDRLRWTRVAEYVDDVEMVVRQLPAPPILVGHSLGGLVVQKYLERHRTPGAVLLSSVPPRGFIAPTLRMARRHPWLVAQMTLRLSFQPLLSHPLLLREFFFSDDVPGERMQTLAARMQDESYRSFLDMLGLDLPEPAAVHTPMLVLGAERDAFFTPREIAATAKAYHAEADIVPGVAHDAMLERGWQAAADRILMWLRTHSIRSLPSS